MIDTRVSIVDLQAIMDRQCERMKMIDTMMSNEDLQAAIDSLMQHLLNHKGYTPIDPMVQQLKALFEIQLQRAGAVK